MNLQKLFIQKLLESGYKERDIRVWGCENLIRKRIKKEGISSFCRKYDLNTGTCYRMLKGKRAVPLEIIKYNLEELGDRALWIVKGSNLPVRIPKKLTKELAYLVGVLRDGTVTQENYGKFAEYCCAYYSKYKSFLEVLKRFIRNTFSLTSKIEKFSDVYGIRIRSLTLYLFFKYVFEAPQHQENWKTPTVIEHANKEIKWWYISGFFDAEGSCPRKVNRNKKLLYVKFVQKNEEALEFIKNFLEREGIECGKIYWNQRKWVMKISHKSIGKFVVNIRSFHPKRKRLIKLLKVFPVQAPKGAGVHRLKGDVS